MHIFSHLESAFFVYLWNSAQHLLAIDMANLVAIKDPKLLLPSGVFWSRGSLLLLLSDITCTHKWFTSAPRVPCPILCGKVMSYPSVCHEHLIQSTSYNRCSTNICYIKSMNGWERTEEISPNYRKAYFAQFLIGRNYELKSSMWAPSKTGNCLLGSGFSGATTRKMTNNI